MKILLTVLGCAFIALGFAKFILVLYKNKKNVTEDDANE